ncbi:MAG: efflux RND transporter periplasmic adaptor subunit [Salinimicrobium sediminis]|uniref:RND family efflux transporter, MFP subunit n=1 Tax=Salinimicrobium sediminis TaxID=1343891 RepID=A0A285X1W9_9FLAO|nr:MULTISPECIES: efflux RND transporter periplasmic adaptor subunit [Salinimicrobium]MDX1601451.1 efflux RND transporter periplasmic adaptor subunit [Salinimicrobium sediminis]SOC79343.1 RND family efflux transporter, MFP subunit [Salinimicrobium sediminis]
MKKKSIITIVALIAVAAIFFLILQNNKSNNEAELSIVAQENTEVSVRTASAQRESISGKFTVNGTFQPETRANISAEMGGQVVGIYVQEGDEVKAGQVIAKLSGDKINVNLNNAKANLDNAISTLERYEAAFKTGGVTAVQLDQARLQVQNARAQFDSANLSSGDTNVRSKVSGIVNEKMVELGMVVGPGTPIIEVVDISSLKLRVEVDEAVVSRIRVGDTVQVVPSVTKDTISGKITFIAPASNGALKFPVEIIVENSERTRRAGMYATAVFNESGLDNVLTIPREAFVGSVSDNRVFVLENGIAKLKEIQTGINYGNKVEVTAGLNEGDIVVSSGQINLTDNTAVKILK